MQNETYEEGDIVTYAGQDWFFICFYSRDINTAILESVNGGPSNVNFRHDTSIIPQGYLPQAREGYNSAAISSITMKEKKKTKIEEFDLVHLEPLIVKDDIKKSIVSVLKQHNNRKKIFEEWGLDEVLEYGKGMTFLFHGPPGTGKTKAAHCIAKTVGTTLLIVGSAEIQTSEPGGANRNIQQAFKTAKSKKQVLFLDECDSLICNRSEVGMILGSEINTLLTEIEKFEGVLILATNLIQHLDEALERRISLIVEFPKPDYGDRLNIWQKLIPKKMPLGKDFNYEKIAEYALTGGQIKNVILSAARQAAADEEKEVGKGHFEEAIKKLQKSSGLMGKGRTQTVHVDVKRGTDLVKT